MKGSTFLFEASSQKSEAKREICELLCENGGKWRLKLEGERLSVLGEREF